MYESPITKIMGEIQEQLIRADENNLMYSVKQSVGYSVDKEELLKALNYDRDQYRKGYQDGFNADKWIPVSERLPEAGEYVGCVAKYYLVQNEYGDMLVASYTHSEYWEQMYQIKPHSAKIVAWMPLPEPYKAESEEWNDET